ncbi:hypothetical protein [Kitasatospora griseola]|uniref:hypothetical protein n=1 Tax=Kitasatospora griseola TaxID=2064 RepID=UPI0016703EE7|nr:hypothetical protein [Kitasatospora griseola]GGQ73175.1 hypothetical protein GCM10010195_31010 [Kitasatospora griseola]
MALREHSRPVTAGRTGRHGRPRPFGGRLRLPTIRFSGAAMAMSTVVGISLATTWLLNEQQQIGRRPGVTVGGPPVPSPDASAPTADATPVEEPVGTQAVPVPALGTATASPLPGPTRTAARPAVATSRPAAPTPSPSVSSPTAPTASASPSPSASDSGTPLAPSPSASPRPEPDPTLPQPLSGTARVDALGRTGTRHVVQLRLDETMTALQVEFRLIRPAALPGTVPATDLPGAVATVALERDTLIYRFTTPSDQPLPPGTYTFTVTGAIAAPTPATPETWTASAFALPTTRAVAARGSF